MTKQDINIPALVALVVFVAAGIAALALGYETIGAALIGTAVGQLGPQPLKVGK
jgi:hypothetical protein